MSKAKINSRNKGSQFERDICLKIEEELGVKVSRNLEQYRSGAQGDIQGLDGWSIECKRRKTGPHFGEEIWLDQVYSATSNNETPVLIIKYDYQPIFCVLPMYAICGDYENEDEYELIATVSFQTWLFLVREAM